MHIDRPRPTVLRVDLHVYELSALISAARWVVEEAGTGELPTEARDQLRKVLENYDKEMRRLNLH